MRILVLESACLDTVHNFQSSSNKFSQEAMSRNYVETAASKIDKHEVDRRDHDAGIRPYSVFVVRTICWLVYSIG